MINSEDVQHFINQCIRLTVERNLAKVSKAVEQSNRAGIYVTIVHITRSLVEEIITELESKGFAVSLTGYSSVTEVEIKIDWSKG